MQYTHCKDMLLCKQCDLHKTRLKVVPGRGDPTAFLWFVGEAPGKEEDETGVAFTGRAGRLLDRCLEKGGIDFFNIVNLLKCRPPNNRDPTEEEMQLCTKAWLYKQIAEYNPRIIVPMGRYSIGFFRDYSWKQIVNMKVTKEVKKPPAKNKFDVVIVPMFHPAYLLRNGGAVVNFIQRLQLIKQISAQITTTSSNNR